MSAYDELFRWYIEKFDILTDSHNNETYKWAACQQFKNCWNPDRDDFSEMLKEALGSLGNVTDATVSPRRSIVEIAKHEPETVREMFLALFSDGELSSRINRFIRDSEPLVTKYWQGQWRYKQTQSSVMAYLACWRPDEHFFYKPTEAKKFAKKVGFSKKWGAGASFKPETYYLMCYQLIDAMRQCDELMQTNERRFKGKEKISGQIRRCIFWLTM